MKKIFAILLGVTMGLAAWVFMSPSALADALPVISNADFIQALLQSLGGMKGASGLVIAGIVVQLLIKLISTDFMGQLFKNFTGAGKLLVVTGLSLVSGVISLMTAGGLTFGAAMLHSTTLAAIMVFGNQLIQHFFQKKS